MSRFVVAFCACAVLAFGSAGAAGSDEYPYERARQEAVSATILIQSRHESVRLHGLEILERMLGEPGVVGVAAMDAAEEFLSPSRRRDIRQSLKGTGAEAFSALERLLGDRLGLSGASKAAIVEIDLGDESLESALDVGASRWYRIAMPSAGRLSMQSRECPAMWAAYSQSASSDGPKRLPYTRAANISEMFFPDAGTYLIRVDPLADCEGIHFSAHWRPDVVFVGAPQKDVPLLRTGTSKNTVTLGAGQSAWFKVIVSGQERITVETSRQRPGVDTVLEVYGPERAIAQLSDDDGGEEQGGSLLDLIGLDRGEYLVRAGELNAGPGSFDVTFKSTVIRAAALGVSDSPPTGEREELLLSYSAKAGHRYRLVTQDLASDVDTYVTVSRRGESEALVENDDAEEGTLSSDVEWDAVVDGEYLITIDGGSGESGQFRYRLSEEPIPVGQCETPRADEKTVVTAATFDNDVDIPSESRLVLVEFWAEWCSACRRFEPILRSVVAESCKSVHLVVVDVDRETDLAMRFGVESVPTIVLYAKGMEVARFQGVRSAAQLRAILRKELSRAGLRAST